MPFFGHKSPFFEAKMSKMYKILVKTPMQHRKSSSYSKFTLHGFWNSYASKSHFARIFESSCKVNPHILRTCYMYVSKNTRGAKIWRLYIFWHTLRNIQWHEIKVSFCRQNYFYLFDYTMMYIVHKYLSLCWTWEFRQ